MSPSLSRQHDSHNPRSVLPHHSVQEVQPRLAMCYVWSLKYVHYVGLESRAALYLSADVGLGCEYAKRTLCLSYPSTRLVLSLQSLQIMFLPYFTRQPDDFFHLTTTRLLPFTRPLVGCDLCVIQVLIFSYPNTFRYSKLTISGRKEYLPM